MLHLSHEKNAAFGKICDSFLILSTQFNGINKKTFFEHIFHQQKDSGNNWFYKTIFSQNDFSDFQ